MTWTFFARALPERVPLSFHIPSYQMSFPHFGVELKFHEVFVDKGQITCQVSTVSGTPDLFFIRNVLEQHLRSLLDFFGYRQGLGFDLDIISATASDGKTVTFGIGIPDLMKAHEANPGQHEVPIELVHAAVTDNAAGIALAQFRKAMREATGTGFYCYQAIEAMMQGTRIEGNDDKEAWERFRSLLNLDRAAIDFVKAHADDRRHGKTSNISDAERSKVFLTTDKIIERYLQYVVGKGAPLNSTSYPLLTAQL